ncbi:ABC transporter ATP-binding protein [Sedimenticola selenatireducens]|uniref:ABC transporter ATP-binding protein n=1 Tax=Sedimenticola selenatireducens TaxID=191960 RepID=A0A558DVY4_9GAMM|nr:ABC transporter ATP-binding protein [Sedimenticola selenatireducens]TVT65212.1 MAG: ABC transporter ATP-binding protein [Sedimenticola selenatireducens]
MMMETDAITIQNLAFQWRKDAAPVLNLPVLQIKRGERVFIMGSSGSGKSTLLSLIGGVLLPQKGTVTVLGQQLNGLSNAQRDSFRAEHIGFIFQMFNLIPYLSVVENVLLPCRFSRRRKQNIENRGHSLQDEAERLLNHLDLPRELLHRSVTELSVGQQQRVAAARALIGSPELVIADEPTSALDADRRASFLKLLLNECAEQNTTLVFVSHDSALEPQFDRSVQLADINNSVN